ncbi:MAG: hypothetical protein EOO24_40850 [Comamonadaceae bacterium]|nr:MAG: hypothetical protein EOO24_40850 [Comamonadaceae bacterium]
MPRLINPTAEDAHWQQSFRAEPYYRPGLGYDDYGPAYRVGYTAPLRRSGGWDEQQPELQVDWDRVKGRSKLSWTEAREAIHAAWMHALGHELQPA